MKQSWKIYLAAITAVSIWSVSYLFTSVALQTLHPLTVVTIRMALAVLFLFFYAKLSGQLQPLERKDIKLFVATGFVQPYFYFICETYSLTMVSPTVAASILATIPLFAPLFAFVLLRERVTFYNLLGIVISLGGVLILVVERERLVARPLGLLLLLLGVVTAILYNIALRKMPSHYNNISIVFYVHLVGVLFFIPTWLLVDMPQLTEMTFPWQALAAIAALALFASVLAYILYAYVVRHLGVTRSTAFSNLTPALTAFFTFLIFGEWLPLVKWLGIAVIIAGLFVCQIRSYDKHAPQATVSEE